MNLLQLIITKTIYL